MTFAEISRRNSIFAGLGMASAMASLPAQTATTLKLEDPKERAKVRAKIVASAADEAVPAFYRLHIFAYMHDKNLVPLYTMNNVAIKVCKPMANGNTMITNYEAGVYCKFDTHEVLEKWQNPITGETLEPWHFIGRPISVEIGPDDVITGPGATLKPKPMAIETVGDTVVMPTMSGFSYPNPFTPTEFPEDSSGPMMYWDSHYVYFAPLKEVADPNVLRASASIQFQNLVSFQPWAGMGTRSGRSWGRAMGTKMKSLDEIPAAARKGLEQKTPMLFDLANWPKGRDDAAEFKKVLRAKRKKA